MADDQESTPETVQFRQAAAQAAQATAKEIPQGGGSAAKQAREVAAGRIQPNLTGSKAGRPMFLQTQPETFSERQTRRGLRPQQADSSEEGPRVIFSLDDLTVAGLRT